MANFTFDLVSPERALMSAEVRQVVVPGAEGEFTVLAEHAPFLSTLRPGIIEATAADGKVHKFFVKSGLADVKDNALTILAQRALNMVDATPEQIEAERTAARETLGSGSDEAVTQANFTMSALANS